jgi:hypothetical protein
MREDAGMAAKKSPGDSVGIQVPAGRIRANRVHWQTVLLAPNKPSIYRLFNEAPRPSDPGNGMIVEVDRAKRPLRVDPGSSVDVMGRHIRVKAGTGGETHSVEGWYVLVS